MDLLSEGQKLNLYIQKSDSIVEMVCSIEHVFDDRLEVALPQYFMRYIEYLQTGCRLTAKAFSKLGTIDFNTVVISSPLEDNFAIELDYNAMKLTPSSEIPVVDAIEIMQINQPEGVQQFKTFEISTSYVKFYSDKKFKLSDIIEGSLILPKDYGIIKFKAVISEIDAVFDNEFTAKFMIMSENDRQNLLYYMYIYSTNAD